MSASSGEIASSSSSSSRDRLFSLFRRFLLCAVSLGVPCAPCGLLFRILRRFFTRPPRRGFRGFKAFSGTMSTLIGWSIEHGHRLQAARAGHRELGGHRPVNDDVVAALRDTDVELAVGAGRWWPRDLRAPPSPRRRGSGNGTLRPAASSSETGIVNSWAPIEGEPDSQRRTLITQGRLAAFDAARTGGVKGSLYAIVADEQPMKKNGDKEARTDVDQLLEAPRVSLHGEPPHHEGARPRAPASPGRSSPS